MLDLALNYQEQLQRKLRQTWLDDRYKYYYSICYREDIDIADSMWTMHQFVSVKDNEVIGYIDYRIDRTSDYAYGLGIINFEDAPTFAFSKDLGEALKNIFEKYALRRLEWSVLVGNPIERSYDRICERYGGRVVGTYKKRIKLIDGKYCDEKVYELDKDDYMKNRANKF